MGLSLTPRSSATDAVHAHAIGDRLSRSAMILAFASALPSQVLRTFILCVVKAFNVLQLIQVLPPLTLQ